MITNEEKKPLKDMEPEEIKAILTDGRYNIEIFRVDDGWVSLAELYAGFDVSYRASFIYRQKPKKLSPKELYEAVKSLDFMCCMKNDGNTQEKIATVSLSKVMELIKQLEGYQEQSND